METNKEFKLGSIVWFKPSIAGRKHWGFIKLYLIDTNKEHCGIMIHALEDTHVHTMHFGWKGVKWDYADNNE
jgi:hypothetical protein